ncbi:hypothetical protein VIBNISO65_1780069 [Vibrio nigripulchritudo SO65]|nr:hypothetical protein VIBNISO65_1780069 [Vibrio nigripulchritudo SO65]
MTMPKYQKLRLCMTNTVKCSKSSGDAMHSKLNSGLIFTVQSPYSVAVATFEFVVTGEPHGMLRM